MANTSSSSTAATATKKAPVAATVPPPPAAAAAAPPAVEKKKVAPKTATAETPAAPAPAPAAVDPPAPSGEEETEIVGNVENVLEDKVAALKQLILQNVQANAVFSRLVTVSLKEIEKEVTKVRKEMKKKGSKRGGSVASGTKRVNNTGGFNKPTKLGDALCAFIGVPKGTEMSRTDANQKIYTYIKENNLRDEVNKRIIKPDAKLNAILDLTELKKDEAIQYFNLAKFTKHNFIKAESAAPAAPVAPAAPAAPK